MFSNPFAPLVKLFQELSDPLKSYYVQALIHAKRAEHDLSRVRVASLCGEFCDSARHTEDLLNDAAKSLGIAQAARDEFFKKATATQAQEWRARIALIDWTLSSCQYTIESINVAFTNRLLEMQREAALPTDNQRASIRNETRGIPTSRTGQTDTGYNKESIGEYGAPIADSAPAQ